jgi:hypothetical protein
VRPLPASNPRTRQAHTRREELVAQALADPDIADRSRATDERRTHPASIPKCAPRWRCPARLCRGRDPRRRRLVHQLARPQLLIWPLSDHLATV